MHLHLNWPGSRSARQRNTESADWPRLRKTLCPAIGFLFSFSVFQFLGFSSPFFSAAFPISPPEKPPGDQIFFCHPMPSLLWLALLPLTLALFALCWLFHWLSLWFINQKFQFKCTGGKECAGKRKILNKLQAHFVAPRCRLIVCRGSSEKVSKKNPPVGCECDLGWVLGQPTYDIHTHIG